MEHGPLPPHERAWRHPSELAAEERAVVRAERSPTISRAFALTTGTIGLFAIVVLVLAVTPSNPSQPIAVSATTTPTVFVPGAGSALDGATIASARGTAGAVPSGVGAALLATPIGSGRYALISQASIGHSPATTFDVTLPSGRTTVGQVVERSADALLVLLDDAEPGHDVAEDRPHDREVVTVMASPPVTIAFADVSTLEVAEGTAVVDSDGDLVGLCTRAAHGRGVRLIAIDAAMATPDDAAVPTRPKPVDDGAPDPSATTTDDDTAADPSIVAADSSPDETDDASTTSSTTSSSTTTTTTTTTTTVSVGR